MANIPGLRADHVALRVADYDETVAWYTEKLGFRVVTEWSQGDAGLRLAYLELKGFRLEILAGGTPEPLDIESVQDSFKRQGYAHFCLKVDDMDAAVAELARRDVELFTTPSDLPPSGNRLAFIRDNSGNVLELAQELRQQ